MALPTRGIFIIFSNRQSIGPVHRIKPQLCQNTDSAKLMHTSGLSALDGMTITMEISTQIGPWGVLYTWWQNAFRTCFWLCLSLCFEGWFSNFDTLFSFYVPQCWDNLAFPFTKSKNLPNYSSSYFFTLQYHPPSERASQERLHHIWFHLNKKSNVGKSIETENRSGLLGLGRGAGWGWMEEW